MLKMQNKAPIQPLINAVRPSLIVRSMKENETLINFHDMSIIIVYS